MRVVLNGEAKSVEATNLEQLCADLGLDGPRVATAVNGDFVPRDARGSTALKDGDAIEVVAPMQGGSGQGGSGQGGSGQGASGRGAEQ